MTAGHSRLPVAVICAAALIPLGGCGASPGSNPAAPPPERADPRPQLAPGWRRVVNARGGFSLAVPREWRARNRGMTTDLRAPPISAAVVVADRSPEGQGAIGLGPYAVQTLRVLPDFRNLKVGRPRRLRRSRYPGVTVRATGVHAQAGIPQDILIAVLRRPRQVTYSLLFFRRPELVTSESTAEAAGMIDSLRGQPPRL